MENRFILEPYKGKSTRYTCPSCGSKNDFTRYLDTETGEYVGHEVGICNRRDNCGYHYPPRRYFKENNLYYKPTLSTPPTLKQRPKRGCIPSDVLAETLKAYDKNTLVIYLKELFGEEKTNELISKYNIGTSKRWPGATIFWFIDNNDKVRYGQIKLFDNTGHTKKYIVNGKEGNCIDCIHSVMKKNYDLRQQPLPCWLKQYLKAEKKISCLFGEHLLKSDPYKPVALVEAPKTAIIASVYFPQYIWLAVGSISYLTEERCQALRNRRVVLFPDLNACAEWSKKASKLSHLASFTTSDLLEIKATQEEREQGLDLADFLVRFDYKEFID